MSKNSVGCFALESLNRVKSNCQTHHPHTATAVMNYDGQMGRPLEHDCAPHPLDVLAIMALYQSAPTPTPTP